jgi:MoaA/NifB/PqqE/SkfB family radical SAM enzyme
MPAPPKLVTIPITSQCNYRCKFCELTGIDSQLRKEGRKYPANLFPLESIAAMSVLIGTAQMVNLGGRTGVGEPLLAKNLREAIEKIREINPHAIIDLTTNGSLLTKELADYLVSIAPLSITFSLHAVSPEIYTDIMGTSEKMYKKTIENLLYFSQVARGKNVQMAINFGIGKKNYLDSQLIVIFARQLGVHSLQMYPYYKSPNAFMEDVSLYENTELANDILSMAYKTAAQIGQPMSPPTPAYIKEEEEANEEGLTYRGGCTEPYTSMVMKADMYHPGKAAFAVCNRISFAHVDITTVTNEDLQWIWDHPLVNEMRSPDPDNLPPICAFCKHPNTPRIRSTDHQRYKELRDQACRDTLAKYQGPGLTESPSGAIKLLEDNIFSEDYQFTK